LISMNMLPEPPPEIIEAAYRVANWAESQLPHGHWEIGPVCSRNHAHELRHYKNERLVPLIPKRASYTDENGYTWVNIPDNPPNPKA